MKTVSNVINGYEHVSQGMRQRVLTAIEEVGYRPNLSARHLARGRSGVIALVVPDLEMPHFASLAGEVLRAAKTRGWFVLLHQTGWDPQAERAALEEAFAPRVDGLIVSSQQLGPEDLTTRTAKTPLVMLSNREFDPDTAHVGIDNHAAAMLAVKHLVDSGCQRIAMIGASGLDSPAPRTQGYLDGLQDAGLPVLPTLVRSVRSNTGDEGERVTQDLLETLDAPPDGILALTDWVGMGVMRALHRHGLSIPDDVAVVGFDDIPYARSFYPSLTTLAPDRREIVNTALDLIEEQLGKRGHHERPGSRYASFRLIQRESTASRLTIGRS